MIRSPFIPVGCGGNHDLSVCNFSIQTSASAKNNVVLGLDFLGGIFDGSHAGRSAQISFQKGESFPMMAELVNGQVPRHCNRLPNLLQAVMLLHIFFNNMGKSYNAGVHNWRVFFPMRNDLCFGLVIKAVCNHFCTPPVIHSSNPAYRRGGGIPRQWGPR